jgi:hypothetical protein
MAIIYCYGKTLEQLERQVQHYHELGYELKENMFCAVPGKISEVEAEDGTKYTYYEYTYVQPMFLEEI